jgi:hypothetical protein
MKSERAYLKKLAYKELDVDEFYEIQQRDKKSKKIVPKVRKSKSKWNDYK